MSARPSSPSATKVQAPRYDGGVEYWDTRHVEDAEDRRKFDWLFEYAELRPLLLRYVNTTASVLQLGCGNSRLALEWCRDGHCGTLQNVDFSPSVVAQMQAEIPPESRYANLSYTVADARVLLDFPSDSFDAVLDKATFDCMSCNARSAPDDSTSDLESMLLSAFRVLRPRGVYILVTCGDPASRLPWLEDEPGLDWDVSASYMRIRSEEATNANFRAEGEARCGRGVGECAVSDAVLVTGNDRWAEEFSAVSEEAHTFVYICRKRARAAGEELREI